MKRILLAVPAAVAIVVLIVMVRTVAAAPKLAAGAQELKRIGINADTAAKHLAQAVRFRTVSTQNLADFDPAPFDAFAAWLRTTYPHFYGTVRTQTLAGHAQINTWKGSDVSLDPLVFMAHQDVVPASEGAGGNWQYPPFAGTIADGFIWGRGSFDDKGALIGLLEAAERLAAQGFAPKRTLIFAFGDNEEIGGDGAPAMAGALKNAGIHPWAVIDEGGAITTNMPDAKGPAARIGVAEKGYLTLTLTARAIGGHSSAPPGRTAIGALSKAIAALEAHPFRHGLDPVLVQMLHATAPAQKFAGRAVISNLWLFGPLVKAKMMRGKSGRALLGTTIAPTIFKAGFKENVLPRQAVALVNFRIHSRDSVASVMAHVRAAIDDPAIDIEKSGNASEPSPVSQIGTGPYAWLSGVIEEVFPGTLIAPNVLVAGTDSRFFALVSDDIYRFAPYTFDASDFSRIHGLNERIGVANFAKGIQAYAVMMQRAGEGK